jgi:YHS domain-containing protein
MKKIMLSVLVVLTGLVVFAQKSEVCTKSGVAIEGYDPVAYFTQGKPTEGSDQFAYKWNGAEWHFMNQKDLDLFKSDPQKYAPQYGGYCAYGMSKGHKATTDPNAWTIVNNKLYLNYSMDVLKMWRDKKEEKIQAADKNWPTVKDAE